MTVHISEFAKGIQVLMAEREKLASKAESLNAHTDALLIQLKNVGIEQRNILTKQIAIDESIAKIIKEAAK